jgi:hypothetical protein
VPEQQYLLKSPYSLKQKLKYTTLARKGGEGFLLFEATHTYPADMCPLKSAEGQAMVKQIFFDANMKRAGIKLNTAYFSCPKDTASDHKGFFSVEVDNAAAVPKYFGQMTVEVRPIQTLAEVVKMLQETKDLKPEHSAVFFICCSLVANHGAPAA